jgi:hypothetical protein
MMMKKKHLLVIGAALCVTAALVLGGCGGGSPEKIQARLEKLQAETLALTGSGDAGDMLKAAKLTTEAVKLMAELEKVQTKAAEKPAKASKSSGGGKEAPATDFIYELNKAGDGVVITGYQKDAAGGAVVIPAKIEGYPVVAVLVTKTTPGYGVFDDFSITGNRKPITSIVFPDSVTEIANQGLGGQGVIAFNKTLKSITFPKVLKKIDAGLLWACDLKDLVPFKWPEELETIGCAPFSKTGLTELVIPEGVKTIEDDAFKNFNNLMSITIPNSVEVIGGDAFAFCPLLTTVKMPAKTIKYDRFVGAFRGNPKLTGIAVRKAITDTGYKGEF